MNAAHSISIIARSMALTGLALATGDAMAQGSFGKDVDTTCQAEPSKSQPYANNGCKLCHESDKDKRATRHEPEWTWTQSGPEDWKNFCVVQAFIAAPTKASVPPDAQVIQNGKLALAARGFSPSGADLTYTWSFTASPPLKLASVKGATPSVSMPDLGDFTVTLNAKDSKGQSDPTPDQRSISVVKKVAITVKPNSYDLKSGEILTVPAPGVLIDDIGNLALSAALESKAEHGQILVYPNGKISYTPDQGYTGKDSFTYRASDATGSNATATVTLNIKAGLPVANDDRYAIQSGKLSKIPAPGVLANDDTAGKPTLLLQKNPSQGILKLSSNGSFTYKPNNGFTGTDSFSYALQNSSGSSIPATVTLGVGTCSDKDKDGYSSEGGNCGPIDCDDQDKAVHPGAKEICDNKIDDNCNNLVDSQDPSCKGKDCIGNYLDLANNLKTNTAVWNSAKSELTVKGTSAITGVTEVSVVDAVSGSLLGKAQVDSNTGTWSLVVKLDAKSAPCSVKAEAKDAKKRVVTSGQKKVQDTTAICAELPSCGG